ncbi:rab11 family-interacting protein 3 isoform X2 [Hyalella azteca]|uniref:Rab11 family-interacting protein 3 isoform X2 n=1 Tax=Hyalella azteca TaxID=294128 RepID=A0A8B7PI27_HYAAZ|nr:rab11 family-interacting protein 3 isoform X2 [Hyalella azteca]
MASASSIVSPEEDRSAVERLQNGIDGKILSDSEFDNTPIENKGHSLNFTDLQRTLTVLGDKVERQTAVADEIDYGMTVVSENESSSNGVKIGGFPPMPVGGEHLSNETENERKFPEKDQVRSEAATIKYGVDNISNAAQNSQEASITEHVSSSQPSAASLINSSKSVENEGEPIKDSHIFSRTELQSDREQKNTELKVQNEVVEQNSEPPDMTLAISHTKVEDSMRDYFLPNFKDSTTRDQSCPESSASNSFGSPSNSSTILMAKSEDVSQCSGLNAVLTTGGTEETSPTPDLKIGTHDVSELRQVFEAVDEEGTGTVKISRFMQLAGLHLGHSQQTITEMLPSVSDDVINFEQFCDVVIALRHSDETLPEAERASNSVSVVEPSPDQVHPEPFQPESPSPPSYPPPPIPSSISPPSFVEAEVFTNYSDAHDDVPLRRTNRQRKQPIRPRGFYRTRSLPAPPSSYRSSTSTNSFFFPNQQSSPYSSSPPADHTLPEEEDLNARMRGEETGSPSSLSEVDSAIGGSTTSPGSCRKANSGTWSVGDREVNYECYGEADDLEEPDVAPYAGDSASPVQPSSLPPATLGHRSSWGRRSLRCAPAAVTFTLGEVEEDHSDMEPEPLMELDGDRLHDADYLHNKVKLLQNRVEVLGDNQNDSQERIVRVKQDNSVLQARVVMLEEQLRDAEQRAEERLADEQRRNRELIQRVEREKALTVENYAIKQENLEKTNARLEEEQQRLRAKLDRQQRERNELENRISEAEIAANNLREENKALLAQVRSEFLAEHDKSEKIILELRGEIERLTSVVESAGRARLPSTDSLSTDHLNATLQALRQHNKSLEEQVEELQAQLLTRGVEEGRELVTAVSGNSLAAEFHAMTQEEVELKERETVEELQKSLHDVQEVNLQLRTYIDGILLNIVENHPQLLEVKRKPSS